MHGRRTAAALGLAAVLLVSGCSADHVSSRAADSQAMPAAQPFVATPGGPQAGKSAQSGVGPVTAGDAKYIAYTAQLTVQVADVRKAADAARGVVEAAGGFVAGESLAGGEDGPASGRLMLKVPSAAHQQALDRLSGLGRQLSLTSQADDVTQQVVDTDSRVKSQQASVDRVRALMAEAKSLSEVVSLEGELSRREADLESLQQQQRALAARTSMSTITLELRRPDQAAPPVAHHRGFWGSVGHALGGGWSALGAVAQGILVVLAAAAPFLLVLGPLGWMLWRLRRRRTNGGGERAPIVGIRAEDESAE